MDIIKECDITKYWLNNNIVVSVVCTAYNHEKYIKDALNGFLMQKTNFPFEVLVNDDASTDNTAKILKEYQENYPNIIKPIYHEVNEYSQGIDIFGNVTKLAKGKYIAICEGDDYWIDENKLQMQVDFLENNPEYGLCYSKAKCYLQNEEKFQKKTIGFPITDFSDLLQNGNRIPTLTTVFRKSLLDMYLQEINPKNKKWLMGDYPMWLYITHESKVRFFEEVTACYRVLENSASHSNDTEKRIAFEKNVYEIRKFYGEKYNVKLEEFDEYLKIYYIYYSCLVKSYQSEILAQLNLCYSKIVKKSFKLKIINLFTKNFILFKIFCIFKNIML